MTELPVQRVLLDGIAEIEKLGVPYAVMGGFAARAWGLPRPTFDADIAIETDDVGMQRLLGALEAAGFDIPDEHRGGFLDRVGPLEKARVTRFVGQHVWTTDLFVARGAFLVNALRRARPAAIGSAHVRVMSPEDIVLLKLIAKRRKDLADIEEICTLCPTMDRAYLEQWARTLGVQDGLREFFPLT